MTRRRKAENEALPMYMAFRHNAYYFRDPVTAKWTRLSDDLETAKAKLRYRSEGPLNSSQIQVYGDERLQTIKLSIKMFDRCCSSAKKRGIPWQLTPQDMLDLFAASDWKCAVSGITFSLSEAIGKRGSKPWAPSLDRIDSRGAYAVGNVRLVCYAVNVALNDWGDEVLLKIAHAMVEKSSHIQPPDEN